MGAGAGCLSVGLDGGDDARLACLLLGDEEWEYNVISYGASVGVFVAESVVDGLAEPLRTVARDARGLLHEVCDEYFARPPFGVIKLTEPHCISS